MAQKRIEDIFKKLAKKYGVPEYVIEEVYKAQFLKLREEINSLEFPVIKLPGWGKYVPSKKKVESKDYTAKRAELAEKKLKKQQNKDGRNN